MHESNQRWFKRCKEIYGKYFGGNISVAEFGSLYLNGSVREWFDKVDEYVGIDWVSGQNVDMVCLAHDFQPQHKFDTIISSSMLEHDPFWERSIEKMVECMKDDGILLLAWQAGASVPHRINSAPDSQYHVLKAPLVLEKLEKLGIYVHEFHYEYRFFKGKSIGWGPVVLIGFKNKLLAVGEKDIEEFISQDAI